MKTLILKIFLILFAIVSVQSQVANNWRGPMRNGIYNEKGLLQEWPASGPKQIWAFEEIGPGFTSPVIDGDKMYVTGLEGETGYVYVLSLSGSLLNKYPYGPEFHRAYPGGRTSVLISENNLYLVSGTGHLVCMDTESGKINWSKELFSDFDAENLQWGYTENLIINEDILYCTPGGKEYNIVALNKNTGDLVWASEGNGDASAYCSPQFADHYGRKMLITHMEKHIVGIDAANGRLLWSYPHTNQHNIHPNAPIYHEGNVFAFSGYGKGGVKLKLNSVGDAVTEEWFSDDFDNQMGGAVLVDGHIYGSGDRNRFWFCVDWETGETIYSMRDLAKGTVIYADGRLYCYTERGELALMEPTPEGFTIKGQTKITLGSDQHWAHLVIDRGVLYVRHGNALMAYNIGAGS